MLFNKLVLNPYEIPRLLVIEDGNEDEPKKLIVCFNFKESCENDFKKVIVMNTNNKIYFFILII